MESQLFVFGLAAHCGDICSKLLHLQSLLFEQSSAQNRFGLVNVQISGHQIFRHHLSRELAVVPEEPKCEEIQSANSKHLLTSMLHIVRDNGSFDLRYNGV
jgi:hypothetical protein